MQSIFGWNPAFCKLRGPLQLKLGKKIHHMILWQREFQPMQRAQVHFLNDQPPIWRGLYYTCLGMSIKEIIRPECSLYTWNGSSKLYCIFNSYCRGCVIYFCAYMYWMYPSYAVVQLVQGSYKPYVSQR